MTERCAWCGRTDPPLIPIDGIDFGGRGQTFAHADHVDPLRRLAGSLGRNQWRFILAFVALQFVFVLGAVLIAAEVGIGLYIAAAAMIGLGITLIVLPFATPQTVRWFGARTAMALARACGVALIAAAGIALVTL